MNYEYLNIQDHVDKWDVEKIRHLEDGIIANEIQADWNQNDSEASDYIKNRPCYKTKMNGELVPEFKLKVNFGCYEDEYGNWFVDPDAYWDAPVYQHKGSSLWVDDSDVYLEVNIEDFGVYRLGPNDYSRPDISFSDYDTISLQWDSETQTIKVGYIYDPAMIQAGSLRMGVKIYGATAYMSLADEYIPNTIPRKRKIQRKRFIELLPFVVVRISKRTLDMQDRT